MRRTLLLFVAALITFSSAIYTPAYSASSLPLTSSSTPVDPDPAAVKAAREEFMSLSNKEKKARIKDVKKEMRKFKKAEKAGSEPSTNTLLLVILAILLPPLAVYLHEGEINTRFWISLILTLLFFVPGVIYALIVVLGD